MATNANADTSTVQSPASEILVAERPRKKQAIAVPNCTDETVLATEAEAEASAGGGDLTTAAPAAPPLPVGWTEVREGSGRVYYENLDLGKMQREHPTLPKTTKKRAAADELSVASKLLAKQKNEGEKLESVMFCWCRFVSWLLACF